MRPFCFFIARVSLRRRSSARMDGVIARIDDVPAQFVPTSARMNGSSAPFYDGLALIYGSFGRIDFASVRSVEQDSV
jgi:hypothetical protein